MMFAAVVGHRFGRATPSLRDARQRQSREMRVVMMANNITNPTFITYC